MYSDILYAMVPYAMEGETGEIDFPDHWIEICNEIDPWIRIRRDIKLIQRCDELEEEDNGS